MAVVSLFVAVTVICLLCLPGKFYCDTKSIFFILGASIFTIVPETQYVYVNDTVTFECATNQNETESSLTFVTYPSVNGSVFTSTGMISLTLTATSEVNGTNVTCHATSGLNTEVTAPAYLYVQGQYNTFFYCKYYCSLPDRQ